MKEYSPLFGMKIVNPMEIVKMNTLELKQHKNPLVIYHKNCADGFAAAWCFWDAQRDWETVFDFHPGVYNEPLPDVDDRIVYLVDFSYDAEHMQSLLERAYHVYLIDHHKSAVDKLTHLFTHSKLTVYVDMDRSGAMLAWDFIHNRHPETGVEFRPGHPDYCNPPLLLEHIQDRDLWKFKLPLTREIQANVFSHEYDFNTWNDLMGMNRAALMSFSVGGQAIERKHHKDIKELLEVTQRTMNIAGYIVPVANLPYTLASDACHVMAKSYEEGRLFAASYFDTAQHRVFSLRSTDHGLDVAKIAEQFGGGGHVRAAGFKVSRLHYLATL